MLDIFKRVVPLNGATRFLLRKIIHMAYGFIDAIFNCSVFCQGECYCCVLFLKSSSNRFNARKMASSIL